MSGTSKPKRIAILGGGMGSLATAFELTSRAGWQDDYDVTVYQMGWRLGGKGASGRNASKSQRIEEHGLHVWLGFYDNAFRVIRAAYDEMPRAADNPFRDWTDAFKKHSVIVLEERVQGRWIDWQLDFPENNLRPGDAVDAPTLWSYVRKLVRWMHDHFATSRFAASSTECARLKDRPLLHRALGALLPDLASLASHIDAACLSVGHLALTGAMHLVEALETDADLHLAEHHGLLVDLLQEFAAWLWEKVGPEIESNDETRRLWIALELAYLNAYGMIKDGVVYKGFECLDGDDYVEWLKKLGGTDVTLASAPIRGFYDLVFAYEGGDVAKPNFAAGVALRSALMVVFDYKGAVFWKMQAGMGDTVFTPLYDVLAARGVKFEFFHKVSNLGLSDDKRRIETIAVERQVTLLEPTYAPLIDVKGIPSWPSEPLYEQIEPVMRAELLRRGIDLESYSNGWSPAEQLTLKRGTDFDHVVLGIPPGAMSKLCPELIAASDAWRDMVREVKTVATQAMQLWLMPTLAELGWTRPSPVMDAYVEPQNTWADMSQLLVREEWSADGGPKNIAYFCGPLLDQFGESPAEALERVTETSIAWLGENAGFLWPKSAPANNPHGLDFDHLIAPLGASGDERARAQYFRANVEPSERYVLSVKGSGRYRLRPGASGFENLFLAGDWTDNGFNAGCIEAATLSGMLAAGGLVSAIAEA